MREVVDCGDAITSATDAPVDDSEDAKNLRGTVSVVSVPNRSC